MNFEKTARSFNMHFSRDCGMICFCGVALPVLKGADMSLCASLSLGGCMALARRADGRFTAEFDDSIKYVSANVAELMFHREEPMLNFLESLQKSGITPCGADVLFEYGTGICGKFEPLLLSASYFFCERTVPPQKLRCFLPASDFVSVVGKGGTLLFSRGDEHKYIKFSDSVAKIVLCTLAEKNETEAADKTVMSAASYLAAGDYVRFGEIITAEYAKMGMSRRTKVLFDTAIRLKDALGCGILENGGIFAVVENKKVNAFIQNIKTEFENYYGAPPIFYVTRPENSGINAIKKGLS